MDKSERDAMRERPILFLSPMVRAILEGRKTKTRRVVMAWSGAGDRSKRIGYHEMFRDGPAPEPSQCPHGQPGDRLWVRETWRCAAGSPRLGGEAAYRADVLIGQDPHSGEWKPSIHMPRWASRLTLEITDVRVERLQQITDDGAEAEGVSIIGGRMADGDYRGFFKSLWNQLNAKRGYGWDKNPWVWVISFSVEGPPSPLSRRKRGKNG